MPMKKKKDHNYNKAYKHVDTASLFKKHVEKKKKKLKMSEMFKMSETKHKQIIKGKKKNY